MPLFPLDIRHQEFSGQMFGYSKKEVRAFLEQVASEVEEFQKQQEKELARRAQMQYEVKTGSPASRKCCRGFETP